MAKNKTTETSASVSAFIAAIGDEQKRDDSYALIALFKSLTKFEPKMWGPSIIGFGTHHYKYASGHEGDMPLAAFSPRKPAIVLYLTQTFEKKEELLAKLGKHKMTKGCVYVKRLSDIDQGVLKKIITASLKDVKKTFPAG